MPITFTPAAETSGNGRGPEPTPGEPKKRRGRPPGSRTAANVESQIKDELTMLFGLGAMLWSARDPQCATVFHQQGPLIAADLAKFASKSKWAQSYLKKVADIGEIIPLVMHVYPVIMAIHDHHVKPKMNLPDMPSADFVENAMGEVYDSLSENYGNG